MVSEERFAKLEDKVEEVKETVGDMRTELALHRQESEIHRKLIETHISGDNKIINEISPILHTLKEIERDHKNKQFVKQKLGQTIKWITIVSGAIVSVVSSFEIWKKF